MIGRGSLRAATAGCPPAPQRFTPAGCRRHRSAGATPAAANHVSGPSSTSSAAGGSPSSLAGGVPAQHMFATRQQPQLGGAFNCGGSCTTKALVLYSKGLQYARNEQWDVARRVFEKTVSECPEFVKPWISWAQMEKRCIACGDDRRWANCRTVLQRALLCNRDAPALLQAWGLMEMQRGNFLAAVLLLDRSAVLEPRNRPVLKWKPVVQARQTVGARRSQHKGTPPAS